MVALAVFSKAKDKPSTDHQRLIQAGLQWLAKNANDDGGWGDTTRSFSNISTTTLCWAAFGAVPGADQAYSVTVKNAERWLTEKAGGIAADQLVPAIIRRYGKDRTFSVPILTMCVLAGRLGQGAEAWKHVIALPFELSVLPARFYATVRLPVVSYALPALIAIGHARHHHLPSRNPVARAVRNRTRSKALEVLTRIQPPNGGFLEATPLTSFVTMSLAGAGLADHPVTLRGISFLEQSVRPDGSWAIDTNLATWVTTLSINALGDGGDKSLSGHDSPALLRWLLDQQYQTVHPYTNAAPGGWAWTDLPGGVPDADDTPGALLALHHLGSKQPEVTAAAAKGVEWLLNLQNSDGGIPTFCRGWGALPFDRSSQDLTAHTLRAWNRWLSDLPPKLRKRTESGIRRGIAYLAKTQRKDGSWLPLWFGNQHAPDDENPTYGTSKVVTALAELANAGTLKDITMIARGSNWLVKQQQACGGWSGYGNGPVSVEETALALEALSTVLMMTNAPTGAAMEAICAALKHGADWLVNQVENGQWKQPSPIGFYFAKLWYYEKLYSQIFTVAALGKARMALKA